MVLFSLMTKKYCYDIWKENKRAQRGAWLVATKLSVALEIDTPMYSKIERGERKAKRSQIPIMAKLFEIDEKTADHLARRQGS